jgi:hypothetical protein
MKVTAINPVFKNILEAYDEFKRIRIHRLF